MTRFSFEFIVDPGVPVGPACHLHGASCTIPWGWDQAHTDSEHPYSLAELEERQVSPHLFAYPDADAYLAGWKLWRALRRDERPNEEEEAVRWAGIEERLQVRLRDDDSGCRS